MDGWLIFSLTLYFMFVCACFAVMVSKVRKYIKKGTKPKLILIDGGKKDKFN